MVLNSFLINWVINAYVSLQTIVPTSGFLKKEDGFYILQENLDKVIL